MYEFTSDLHEKQKNWLINMMLHHQHFMYQFVTDKEVIDILKRNYYRENEKDKLNSMRKEWLRYGTKETD